MNIREIHFEIAVAAGLVAAAKKDKVSVRQRDIIFVIDGVRAVGCLRKMNSQTVRMCGCWVAPELRGKGYGKSLVLHRFAYAAQKTAAKKIDTFAFHPKMFLELGFVAHKKFKMGTTHLIYEVPNEVIVERHKWDSAYWK